MSASEVKARRAATESHGTNKTVGHTVKGIPRKAHTPTDEKVLSRPIITPDAGAKIPASVRQRYLNSIIEECQKIYPGNNNKAFRRAEDEEKLCHNRAKNLRNIYLHHAVGAIKTLRKEATEAAKKRAAEPTPGPSSSSGSRPQQHPAPKRNQLTTHLQVLAGKAGANCSWSIEKTRKKAEEEDKKGLSPQVFYAVLSQRYCLTPEQLESNCFPVAHPTLKGRAVVKADPFRPAKKQPPEPNLRRCDRCSTTYAVDKDGRQVLGPKEGGECIYHWGRLFKRRGNRGESAGNKERKMPND